MAGILVTGGAGYIGSHIVKKLGEQGDSLIVLDNLSRGYREAVLYGNLIVGDCGDQTLVTQIIEEHNIDTVLHFAAYTIVPESVSTPLKYYHNNTLNTCNLIECCLQSMVKYFIFSSTAAVYGIPADGVVTEDSPTAPINPYGASKMMSERILSDAAQASELGYVILRYFNVAGSDPSGQIGQSTPEATLLIKVACEAALGKRDAIEIRGTDYPTPDGTGIRDYIHVEDLATAHIQALDYLQAGGPSTIFNCGYGHGASVREVLRTVEKIIGRSLNIHEAARRPGDPSTLIAEAVRIKSELGWQPQFDDLEAIIDSSLQWEKSPRYGISI